MKNNGNIFYQVFHKGASVGFFRKKSNAEKYAKEFHTNIGGYLYPMDIREKEFLDESYEEESEDYPDETNWSAWEDEHDTTSENGGV